MRPFARLPLPLALTAGLCIGLGGAAALAGSAPVSQPIAPAPSVAEPTPVSTTAAASRTSSSTTTPSLGEAFGPSSTSQISLAEHLRAKGVIFYGAFWCLHCFHQKVLFGQEAGNRLPYVECAKDEAGAKACDAAGITAYPTWVMGKERLVGVQTLKELATWSQYGGASDFPNTKKKGG